MNKVYQLVEQRKSQLAFNHNKQIVFIGGGIMLFFLIVTLLHDKSFSSSLFLGFMFICILIISIFLRTFNGNKLADTIIVLEDNKITRRGANLLEVTISYKNIKRIKEKSIGLIILDDSPYTSVEYYTSKYALSSSEGVIFIPKEIECFDEIREFLYNKTDVSVRYSF